MTVTKVFASLPSNRVPKKIHIADVKVGDVVLRETDGVAVTVCSKDLTHCDFLGTRLFGDSYMLGYKPVTLLELIPATRMNELLIAKLEQEIKEAFAENAKKDANRSKTSYKAGMASTSAFALMSRETARKEAIIHYIKNGFKLSRWDVVDLLGETNFYLTAPEKLKLLGGSSSSYSMDVLQENMATFHLGEKLKKDYQKELKHLNKECPKELSFIF